MRHGPARLAILFAVLLAVLALLPDPAGAAPLWSRRVDGPAHADDAAHAVAATPEGGFVLAGFAGTGRAGRDIWVRRCAADGSPLWTRTVDGPGHGDDEARAVAVAPDGAVYVAGFVTVPGGGRDLWLRKYSPAGRVRWTRTRDGGSGGDDLLAAVAISPGGAVLVAGATAVAGGGTDALVAAYSTAGTRGWERRSPGTAAGVAVSTAGTIFAAGSRDGPGGDRDGLLLLFAADGAPAGERLFPGGGGGDDEFAALAISGDGTVFGAGTTTTGNGAREVLVRAWSGTGDRLWTETFGGRAGEDARGFGIAALPGGGGLLVVGETATPARGTNLWTRTLSPRGLTLGSGIWGGRRNEAARAAAITSSGAVVVGLADSRVRGTDLLAQGWEVPTGRRLWVKRFDPGVNLMAMAEAAAPTPDGGVVVTGQRQRAEVGSGLWLRRYRGDGAVAWTRDLPPADAALTGGRGVAVGPDGSIYAAGYAPCLTTSTHSFILEKYSGDGEFLWRRTAAVPDPWLGRPRCGTGQAVSVDPDGSVYLAGTLRAPAAAYRSYDLWVGKFGPEGDLLWSDIHVGPGGGDGEGHAVAAVPGSGAVVAGMVYDRATRVKWIFLRRYDADGAVLWDRAAGSGLPACANLAAGVAVAPTGEVYAAGMTQSVPGVPARAWLAKYAAEGTELWERSSRRKIQFEAVAVDGEGGVVAAGSRSHARGRPESLLQRFAPDGSLLWSRRWKNPGGSPRNDQWRGLALGPRGSVFAAGGTLEGAIESDGVIAAYWY